MAFCFLYVGSRLAHTHAHTHFALWSCSLARCVRTVPHAFFLSLPIALCRLLFSFLFSFPAAAALFFFSFCFCFCFVCALGPQFIGADYSVIPILADAQDISVAQGNITFSIRAPNPVDVRPENIDEFGTKNYNIYVFLPVYATPSTQAATADSSTLLSGVPLVDIKGADARLNDAIGVVLGEIRAFTSLKSVLQTVENYPMVLELYDLDAASPELAFIARANALNDTVEKYTATQAFTLSGRNYEMRCIPTHAWIESGYSSTPLIISVGAAGIVLINLVLIVALALIWGWHRAVEKSVELEEANHKRAEAVATLEHAQSVSDAANQSKSEFLGFLSVAQKQKKKNKTTHAHAMLSCLCISLACLLACLLACTNSYFSFICCSFCCFVSCHELRNPLHAIGSMMEFLHGSESLQLRAEHEDLECLDVIDSQVKLMNVRERRHTNSERQTASQARLASAERGKSFIFCFCSALSSSRLFPTSLQVLVNDALDLSKIEAGKMTFERIGFSLAKLVRATAAGLKARAHAQGIALRTVIAPDLARIVYGDPTRLRQVLANMLSNGQQPSSDRRKQPPSAFPIADSFSLPLCSFRYPLPAAIKFTNGQPTSKQRAASIRTGRHIWLK